QLQVVADLLSPFAGPRAAELAERLIGKFGSLGRALSADPDRIGDADLAEACRIVHAARRLTESALREKLDGTRVRSDDPRLRAALQAPLAAAPAERFHAIFLDGESRYLRDETIASGGVRQIQFKARTLFGRALELDARQLLLAHNHPSGDCRPS